MTQNREEVSLEELIYVEIVQTEAITRLLIQKGIITENEILIEAKKVQAERAKTTD